jgi:hypothetical protein
MSEQPGRSLAYHRDRLGFEIEFDYEGFSVGESRAKSRGAAGRSVADHDGRRCSASVGGLSCLATKGV